MFSKEEAKQIRIAFWTAFGVYMRQHESLLGPKQKWVNYDTGVKGIFFRLEAESKFARVSITLEQSDPGIRDLFFDQWEELRRYLESESDAQWTWERHHTLESGREISRIYRELRGKTIFEQQDWAAIFEFLEACILPLDSVWSDCNEAFKDLAN